MKEYTYDNVKVTKVTDGDTFHFEVLVDIGFNIKTIANIVTRLRGVDTPEIYRPINESELKHGRQAKEYVAKIFNVARTIKLKTYKTGMYGRWEADVFVEFPNNLGNFQSLAKLLIDNGYEKMESYS